MDEKLWTTVDRYFTDTLRLDDPDLGAAVTACEAAGLPPIQVTPNQGKLLHLLARTIGARRILEIGTLGGYSAIWLARALPPGGRLVTLEFEPKHAAVALENLTRAGVAGRVEIRVGAALEALPKLAAEGGDPFDLVFIDADKENNPDYFEWALRLTRPGSLIIVDNVARHGEVIDASSPDAAVTATRRVLELMASDPRVSATAIQTVGTKGYDAFAIARVADGATRQ
jgi:predicted O-methyltransferase YrrM